MPRKTDTPLEETAVNTPLRRSTRKTSVNSPAPSTITTGKITQNQSEPASKTKSALSSQENGNQEDLKKQPATRGRRASTNTEESESKPEPIKTRSRRSSATSESAVEEQPKTQPITRRRRSSATEELTVSDSVKPVRSRRSSASEKPTAEEPAKITRTRRGSSKDEEPKEEPIKRITRSRRSSVDKVEEIEPNEKRPNTRRRGSFTEELNSEPESKSIKLTPVKSKRRTLVIENTGNLEPIVELEPIIEREVKSRKSNSPIIEKSVITSVDSPKQTELKTNLNLSVINETPEETLNNESKSKSEEVVTPRRSPRLSKQKSPEDLISLTTPSKKIVAMENYEIENVEGTSINKEEPFKSISQKLDFQDTDNMKSKNEKNEDQNQTDLLNTSEEHEIQNEAIEIIDEKVETVPVSNTLEDKNYNMERESKESSKLHEDKSTPQAENAEEKEDVLNTSKSSSTSDKENENTNVFSSPAVSKLIGENENPVLVTLTNEENDNRNSTRQVIKENVQKTSLSLEGSLLIEESAMIMKKSPQVAKGSPRSAKKKSQPIKNSPSVKESFHIVATSLQTESNLKKLSPEDSMSPQRTKQSRDEHDIKKTPPGSIKPERKSFTEKLKAARKEIDEEMNLSKQNKHSVSQEVLVKESSFLIIEGNNETEEITYDNLKNLSKNSSVEEKTDTISKPSTSTFEENLQDKPKSKQCKEHENTFDSMESPATNNLRISDIEAQVRRSVSPIFRGKSKSPQPVAAEKTLENEIVSLQSVIKNVKETDKATISHGESSNDLSKNSESTNCVQFDNSENEIEEIEQSPTKDIDSKATPPNLKESLKSCSDDYEFEVPSDEEESAKPQASECDKSTVVASLSQTVDVVTVSTDPEAVMSRNKNGHSELSTDSSHFETKEETCRSALSKDSKHYNGVKSYGNSGITEENSIEQELETDSYVKLDEDLIRVQAEVQRIITRESSSSECSENGDANSTDKNFDLNTENEDSFSRQLKTCIIESSSVEDVNDDSVKHNTRKVVHLLENIQLKGKDIEKISKTTNDDRKTESVEGKINISLCEEDWEIVEDIKNKNEDKNETSPTKKLNKTTGGVEDIECNVDIKKDSATYDLNSESVQVASNLNLCENPENKNNENEIILKRRSNRVARRLVGTKLKENAETTVANSKNDEALECRADLGKGEHKDSSPIKPKNNSANIDKEFENDKTEKSPVDCDLKKSKTSNQKRKSDEHDKHTENPKKSKKVELNTEECEDIEEKGSKEKIAKKKKSSLKSSEKATFREDKEDNDTVIYKTGIEEFENKTNTSDSDSDVFTETKENSKNHDSSKRASLSIVDDYILKKITERTSEEEDNSHESNEFLYTMAEEGEEDTPSEDSNAIIDEGESIGSSDSDLGSDDEYDQNDSFICDDENEQLLSGEEYDLEDESRSKKKKSRIIQLDSCDEDIIKIERKEKTPFKKKKSRIITVSDSSESEQHEDDNIEDVKISNKSNESQEIIYVADKTDDAILEPKPITANQEDSSNLRPDPSPIQHTTKKRLSSLTIHENISVKDIKQGSFSGHIINLLDGFCTTKRKGDISLNLSIECSVQDSNDSAEEKQGNKNAKNLTSESDTPGELFVNNEQNVQSEEKTVVEQKHTKEQRKLSVSIDDSNLTVSKRLIRKRAKHTKSMDNLNQIEPISKKKKIDKKKNEKCPEIDDLPQKNKRIKNRPKRIAKPSTSMNDSWFTELVHVVPSTSTFDNQEKAAFKAGKVHPKDFRSQMLNDPSRVRRVDTKTMLKKKGKYF